MHGESYVVGVSRAHTYNLQPQTADRCQWRELLAPTRTAYFTAAPTAFLNYNGELHTRRVPRLVGAAHHLGKLVRVQGVCAGLLPAAVRVAVWEHAAAFSRLLFWPHPRLGRAHLV